MMSVRTNLHRFLRFKTDNRDSINELLIHCCYQFKVLSVRYLANCIRELHITAHLSMSGAIIPFICTLSLHRFPLSA